MSKIAVVVATRDRPSLLRRCLDALAEQERPPDELILIDDASVRPVADIVTSYEDRLPIRVLRNDRALGPGRARQRAWREATSEFVAFTDDDCRPSPGWLAAFAAALGPLRILVGCTIPDPDYGPPTSVFDRSMRIERNDGRFSTCNITYPRALLEMVGGFDRAFDMYGEDTDLGQRALAAGAEALWVPEALVWHAVHRPAALDALRERTRVGEIARLVHRHPKLKRQIWEGPFWKPQHRQLAYAIAGLAAVPLTPFALVGLIPWLRVAPARLRTVVPDAGRHDRFWQFGQVAGMAAIDAVELASCAIGSARHRTLFL
jgi:GT2 family glycosyltransferase